MKKTPLLILLLVLLLALTACGRTEDPAPTEKNDLADEILSGVNEAAEAPEPIGESAPDEAEPDTPASDFEPDFRFSTTTPDGAAADESILAGHTLTMINFFEPWCPPCIAELPDLEKLYETYAPQGFQIIGVFSTEEGLASVLADAGISYPVLRYVKEFDRFQTGYVPTTIFVDAQGRLVGETQIGSNSYEGWEAIIKELMK